MQNFNAARDARDLDSTDQKDYQSGQVLEKHKSYLQSPAVSSNRKRDSIPNNLAQRNTLKGQKLESAKKKETAFGSRTGNDELAGGFKTARTTQKKLLGQSNQDSIQQSKYIQKPTFGCDRKSIANDKKTIQSIKQPIETPKATKKLSQTSPQKAAMRVKKSPPKMSQPCQMEADKLNGASGDNQFGFQNTFGKHPGEQQNSQIVEEEQEQGTDVLQFHMDKYHGYSPQQPILERIVEDQPLDFKEDYQIGKYHRERHSEVNNTPSPIRKSKSQNFMLHAQATSPQREKQTVRSPNRIETPLSEKCQDTPLFERAQSKLDG